MAITLTEEDITALRRYRAFVQDYYVDFEPHDGITQPHNDNGELAEGALCLGTGKPGPTIAIDAMMHKNEPAGIAAQMDIIERWQKGDRPKQGAIILTLGTPPQLVIEFLDDVIANAERGEPIDNDAGHHVHDEHIAQLAEAVYPQTHGKILDIHSTASPDEPMLLPYLPRSTIKQAIGFDQIETGLSEDQDYVISNEVVSTAIKRGLVGDFDDNLTEEVVYGLAVDYHKAKHDLEGTARDMCEHINSMPVKHVMADFYHGVLDSGFSGVMLNPILKTKKLDGIPTVLETGGPNLASNHHHVAVDCARAYTHNILGWPKQIPSLPKSHRRYYYTDSGSVVRPHERNSEDATHQTESYLLLHDAADIPDELKAKADIDWQSIKLGRLNSFAPIKEGDPIAIGEESGNIIRADKDGYIAITPGGRIDAEYSHNTAVAAIASERVDERDIAPMAGVERT